MKRLLNVFVLIAFFAPVCSYASDDWYAQIGVVKMIAKDIPTSGLVKQMDKAGVVYTSSLENTSAVQSFSIGKCSNQYVCFELGRIDGAEFSNTIVANSADIGVLDYGGYSYNVGTQSINLTVRQKATISATQLSMISKLPVNKWFDVFARVGVYNYRLDLETTVPVYQDNDHTINLSEKTTEHGLFPVASIGIHVMPCKDWVIGAEYQKTGRLSVISANIGYKF